MKQKRTVGKPKPPTPEWSLDLFDNTRISDFQTCPLYFYWRHEREFCSDDEDIWLTFGSAWHSAMDQVWTLLPKGKKDDEVVAAAMSAFRAKWDEGRTSRFADDPARNPGVAQEMLYSYCIERRRLLCHKSFRLIDCERPFAVPLDPEDPNLFYVGRLDKIFEYEGRIYVGEHKTSTAYSKDGTFRSYFIDSFSPNRQIDGYLYAGNMLFGDKFKAVWVDASLVHKDVHDGFRIIPIDRSLVHLDQWLWETRYWIDQITANREAAKRHHNAELLAAFPKNTRSCNQFGKACPFLDQCKVTANPARVPNPPAGFHKERWEPYSREELERALRGA